MFNQIVTYLSWWFLPNLVTAFVQHVYYFVTIRNSRSKPSPGSQRYIKDRQRIYVALVVAYMLYNIYKADLELRTAGNFYQDLGVPYDVDERSMQSRFRRLTAQYHPDKVSAENRQPAQTQYIHLTLARDTLVDPAKRFAYDRFGPDILRWQNCITIRDYLVASVTPIGAYYAQALVAMLMSSRYLQHGSNLRLFALAVMIVFEAYTATRPNFPIFLVKFLNPILAFLPAHSPYLPFQLLTLTRKITEATLLAVALIAPILQTRVPAEDNSEKAIQQRLDALDKLGHATDGLATSLLQLEMTPFESTPEDLEAVRTRIVEWLVRNSVHISPGVVDAVERARKRRAGVLEQTDALGRREG